MKKLLHAYGFAFFSYITWGLLPMFWALLSDVPSITVLFHRVFWSMVLLSILLAATNRLNRTFEHLHDPKKLLGLLLSAFLLGTNWFTYVWAIAEGKVMQASLGYFICPVLSVGLGWALFRERLTIGQAVSVGIFLLGIMIPVVLYGSLPWIALLLAGSWAMYTAIRKRIDVPAEEGVLLETLMILPAIAALAPQFTGGGIDMGFSSDAVQMTLLILAGVVTVVPQIALIRGLKFVPLKVIGVLQYLTPTLMLVVSALYFDEVPSPSEVITMGIIWVGIFTFFYADKFLRVLQGVFHPKAAPGPIAP